jgi:hypothetical protein
MKVTLYAFWHLSRQEGSLRYLTGGILPKIPACWKGCPAVRKRSQAHWTGRCGAAPCCVPNQPGGDGRLPVFSQYPAWQAAYQGLLKGTWQPEDGSHPEIPGTGTPQYFPPV